VSTRTVFRSCTLCEAACGLRFEVEGDRITSVRPDPDDVLSHGYVCPKGVAIADVHHDPDRVRRPLVRGADGAIRAAHGADAIGIYVGNPIATTTAPSWCAPAS
jgi:anaerobic selenocysteine-containing dehydrogenase